MKKIFLILTFLTLSATCFAQQPKFLDVGMSLHKYFLYSTRYPAVMRENNQMPFTYVKFKISSQNKIDSLIITNKSSAEMADELTRVLLKTEGKWNVSETKDQWFIVPVIFHSDKDGDTKKILDDQYKEQQFENKETNAVYFPLVVISAITVR